jgi:CheY-like chemotaxis protein
VDDEIQLAASLKLGLTKLGYRVTVFTNPVEALQHLVASGHQYDLVLTDLSMPLMNGTDLARKILALRPELPVLLMTGHAEGWTLGELRQLGVRDLLHKPLSLADLAAAIARALAPLAQ